MMNKGRVEYLKVLIGSAPRTRPYAQKVLRSSKIAITEGQIKGMKSANHDKC
jgi:hypothetical protein